MASSYSAAAWQHRGNPPPYHQNFHILSWWQMWKFLILSTQPHTDGKSVEINLGSRSFQRLELPQTSYLEQSLSIVLFFVLFFFLPFKGVIYRRNKWGQHIIKVTKINCSCHYILSLTSHAASGPDWEPDLRDMFTSLAQELWTGLGLVC